MSKQTDLEKENQELRWEIDCLRDQNDVYRFHHEMQGWPTVGDIIHDTLARDVAQAEARLADLKQQILQCEQILKEGQKAAADKQDIIQEIKTLQATLEKNRVQVSTIGNIEPLMELVRRLCITYTWDGKYFIYKGGVIKSKLSLGDVEGLVRRNLRAMSSIKI